MGFWDSLGSGKKKGQSNRTPDCSAQGVDPGRSGGAVARPRALSLTGDTTRRRAEKQQPGSPADLHLLRHPSLVLPNSRPPPVGPKSLEESWGALQSGGAVSLTPNLAAAKQGRGRPGPGLPRVGSEPAAQREAGAEAARASVASVDSSSTLSTDGATSREAAATAAAPHGSRSGIRDFFQGDLRDSRRQMKQASRTKLQASPNLARTSASSAGSPGPKPRAHRLSAASNLSSSSWDRLGNLEDGMAHQGSGAAAAAAAGQPSLFHLAQAYLRRQPSGEPAPGRMSADGPLSIVSGGNDLQSTMSMSSQLLDSALDVMGDSHQRAAIRDSLASSNLNKRIVWMNKVLGSTYLEDHIDDAPDEGEVQTNVVFHPHSPFRARWDLLVILVIVYQVAVMPVRVAWGDNKPGMLMYIEMLMSGILLLDVLLSFNTGFQTKGDLVMDKSRVRRHFALGWFVPDLVSSLPYDALALLAMNADKHSPKAIGLRAVRLLGLLRWPRLWKYVQRWEDMLGFDSVILRIGKYWLAIIMFIHTVACLQVLEAYLEKGNLSSFLQRAHLINGAPTQSLMGRGPFVQYSYAIFRSQANVLVCGWGVDTVQTFPELWVVLATQFFGSLFQLVFQAAIITTIRVYDRSGAEYLQRLEMLRGFFARHRLPEGIRARAMAQYTARHPNQRIMREDALLRDMTPHMRGDLLLHQAREALRAQPIFSAWQDPATRAVACEMVQAVFAPGDAIFHKGDSAECMYFVAQGVVRLSDPDTGKVLTRISSGSYFGEFALLQGQNGVRTANAVALTTTALFSLSCKSFYRIAAHYPEIMESLVIVAAAREAMNRDQKVFSTDLLRIKDSRASFLMNTCRAAVAEGIAEGDEEIAKEEEKENS